MYTLIFQFFRQLSVFTSVLVLILAAVSGCSSGDDGEVVVLPGDVPDQLNYEIRQGTGAQLTLTQNPTATVTVSSTLLTGTFNRITQAFTLNVQPAAMVVSASDYLAQFDNDLGNTNFSDYNLHVITAAAWVSDGVPTSGVFEIFDNEFRKITVSVNPNVNPGEAGVDITYWPNGEGDPGSSVSDSLTWEEFDGLLENPVAEPYAKIAAFAYSLLRFMYEQGELVILALEFLSENDLLLEQNLSIIEDCDTYPPLLPPDQVVADPGENLISWTDASFDGELGPGDNFLLNFTQCWDDDETDDIDRLFHGPVNFVNYTEVQSGGVITRVGFEPTNGPGGIDFGTFGLEITETETSSTNTVIRFDETITVTGGFSMVFTSP